MQNASFGLKLSHTASLACLQAGLVELHLTH
jgi:hypothetical protein